MSAAAVLAVCSDKEHNFSKPDCTEITITEGLGVVGDAHYGKTVKHRSRVAKDPTTPNLRQVHLIHSELFDEVAAKGFDVSAGQLGENITTRGVDLLSLPTGTTLHIGTDAIVEITGLRNPCAQIDKFQKGLMKACLEKRDGRLIRKTGVMSIVLRSGVIAAGDRIEIVLPEKPHKALEVV